MKKQVKKLALKKETVRELSSKELVDVAGGVRKKPGGGGTGTGYCSRCEYGGWTCTCV